MLTVLYMDAGYPANRVGVFLSLLRKVTTMVSWPSYARLRPPKPAAKSFSKPTYVSFTLTTCRLPTPA